MRKRNKKSAASGAGNQADLFAIGLDAPASRQPPLRPAPALVAPRKPAPPAPVIGKPEAPKPTPKAKPPAAVLRVQDAALHVGLSVSTLNKMRCDGRGPRFIKLTGKTVGYAIEDLDAWVAARREQRAPT